MSPSGLQGEFPLHPPQEEHGYLTLLAVFDTVDDTVLVRKALLDVSGAVVACVSLRQTH